MNTYLMCMLIVSIFWAVYYSCVFQVKIAKASINNQDVSTTKIEAFNSFIIPAGVIALILLSVKWFFYDFAVIPSASMMPNFKIGQKVLLDKSAFGFRLPFDNSIIISGGKPKHGQVVVTQFPKNPQIMYLKRVIGLPGDVISLTEKALQINEHLYPLKPLGIYEISINDDKHSYHRYEIKINENQWLYMVDAQKEFPEIQVIKVPEQGYYLLGDNLTGSSDSRDFGPIPFDYFMASLI